ncbi:unnamed protein product, partial [Iphiclides podalirius]
MVIFRNRTLRYFQLLGMRPPASLSHLARLLRVSPRAELGGKNSSAIKHVDLERAKSNKEAAAPASYYILPDARHSGLPRIYPTCVRKITARQTFTSELPISISRR